MPSPLGFKRDFLYAQNMYLRYRYFHFKLIVSKVVVLINEVNFQNPFNTIIQLKIVGENL